MAGGHNKVEYCCGSHLKESGFRLVYRSVLISPSPQPGARPQEAYKVARVRGVLGHLPHTAALWLAVASHCCSKESCIMRACL